MGKRAEIGDWVQVEEVVLEAGKRAPQVPEDTQGLPLVMRVKGFAEDTAAPGEEITVQTVVGRRVTGKLVEVDPAYDHDFGRPVVELIHVGLEAREMLDQLKNEERGDGS